MHIFSNITNRFSLKPLEPKTTLLCNAISKFEVNPTTSWFLAITEMRREHFVDWYRRYWQDYEVLTSDFQDAGKVERSDYQAFELHETSSLGIEGSAVDSSRQQQLKKGYPETK